jgi:hypothetical protein
VPFDELAEGLFVAATGEFNQFKVRLFDYRYSLLASLILYSGLLAPKGYRAGYSIINYFKGRVN